jgi:KUP system potassium uptake protein
MDDPNVPAALRVIAAAPIESPIDADHATYFLSTIDLYRGNTPGLNRWRKSLFLATTHITADAADYFHLPRDRTLIVGSRIEL